MARFDVDAESVAKLFDEPQRIERYLEENPRRRPKTEYLEHNGKLLGVKLVVYLSQETADLGLDDITSDEARAILRRAGFRNFVSKSEAELITTPGTVERVLEVHKRTEASIWTRNAAIRKDAIDNAGHRCHACGLRPSDRYSGPDDGCLEVHHIRPLYTYDGSEQSVCVDELLCLCANCHRMIHHRIAAENQAITLQEFKATLLD